jgi:hypothetical protein
MKQSLRLARLAPLALACALVSTSGLARDGVKDRIYRLTQDIEDALWDSRADREQLRAAAEKLQEALRLVRGRTNPDEPKVRVQLADVALVAGNNVQYYSDQAMSSWQSACTQVETTLRQIVGADKLESFSCGTPQNVTPWSTSSYYLYASSASAVVVSDGEVFEQAGTVVSGENIQYYKDKAYQSWSARCLQQLQSAKSQYGERFVGGACGQPQNVTPWPSSSYFQFQSTPKLWLKRLDH